LKAIDTCECAFTQFVCKVIKAVRRHANKAALRFSFTVLQISTELCLCIVAFAPQVALDFEDGVSKQRINPASRFDSLFLDDVGRRGTQIGDQGTA
jgi:hypothetical protein